MEREAKVGVFRRNYEQEQTRPESLLLLQPMRGSELPLKVIALRAAIRLAAATRRDDPKADRHG
jgi:hypothetical protein